MLPGAPRSLRCALLFVALLGSSQPTAADLSREESALLEQAARLGPKGQEEAKRQGQALNVHALSTMFARGERDLVLSYAQGMRLERLASLPPDIERLVIERFPDRELVDAILSAAPYRSRALFMLLYERTRNEQKNGNAKTFVLNTRLAGIEADILAIADRFSVESLAWFFGERRYAGALPYLVAALQREEPGSPTARPIAGALAKIGGQGAADALVARISTVTAKIPERPRARESDARTSESRRDETVIRLDVQGAREPTPIVRELENLLNFEGLGQLAYETEIDHAVVLAAAERANTDSAWFSYAALAGRRQWPEAVAYLLPRLAALPDPTRYPDGRTAFSGNTGPPAALSALRGYPDASVWRRTRTKLGDLAQQGQISAGARDYAMSLIPDPDARDAADRVAATRASAITGARYLRLATLEPLREAALAEKRWDSEAFVVASERYLHAIEELRGNDSPPTLFYSELFYGYLTLGHVARFRLGNVDKAINYYRRAQRSIADVQSRDAEISWNRARVLFALADAYQFGKQDFIATRSALEQLVAVVDAAKPPPPEHPARTVGGAYHLGWMRSAASRDLAAIERGARFSGKLGEADLTAFVGMAVGTQLPYGLALDFATELPADAVRARAAAVGLQSVPPSISGSDRESIARYLAAVPPSRYTLFSALPLLTLLPPGDRLSIFLERNDPGGYTAGCLAAVIDALSTFAISQPTDAAPAKPPALPGNAAVHLPGIFALPARDVAPLREAAQTYLRRFDIIVVESDTQRWFPPIASGIPPGTKAITHGFIGQ